MLARTLSALALLALAGCASSEQTTKPAPPAPFHKVQDDLCVDRGEALLLYAESKAALTELRGMIVRGCRSGKFDKATCASLEGLRPQLATAEEALQEKILNPQSVVDVKKVIAALKIIAGIAGKLL